MMKFNCKKINQTFCKIISNHYWKDVEDTNLQECMFCGCIQVKENSYTEEHLIVDIE